MILDTGFLIDLMRRRANALGKHMAIEDSKADYKVSAATIFELWVGITLSDRSAHEKEKVVSVLSGFNTIPMTAEIAEKAGELHGSLLKSGNPIGVLDSIIAATALLGNETLLTGDASDFVRVKGLRVENY